MEIEQDLKNNFSKKEWLLLLLGLVCIFDTLLCVSPEFDFFSIMPPPIGKLWIKYELGVQVIGGSVKLFGFACLLVLGFLRWKKEKKRWLLFGCVLPAINCMYYVCYIAVVLGITVFQIPFLTKLYTQLFCVAHYEEWERVWSTIYWLSLYLSHLIRVMTGVFWLVYILKRRKESTDGCRKGGCFVAMLIMSIAINVLVLNVFTVGYLFIRDWLNETLLMWFAVVVQVLLVLCGLWQLKKD